MDSSILEFVFLIAVIAVPMILKKFFGVDLEGDASGGSAPAPRRRMYDSPDKPTAKRMISSAEEAARYGYDKSSYEFKRTQKNPRPPKKNVKTWAENFPAPSLDTPYGFSSYEEYAEPAQSSSRGREALQKAMHELSDACEKTELPQAQVRDENSVGAENLREILKSTDTLKTAFVASELLGLPLALRRKDGGCGLNF